MKKHSASKSSIATSRTLELTKPGTIVWAKLRGYPWWPGKIKGPDECPRELVHIAKTQYKPQSMIIVYFFGSHDFSLVPVDCLKEFESNWEEFYNKSTSTRFNMALQESRDPEKFKQFERAAILTQVESSPVKVPSTIDREPSGAEQSSVKRKRGRPPKSKSINNKLSPLSMTKFDTQGNVTLSHLQSCRFKLQKILLRTPLKVSEVKVGQTILNAVINYKIPLELLKDSRLAIVLQKAVRRAELLNHPQYLELLKLARQALDHWHKEVLQYKKELGLF